MKRKLSQNGYMEKIHKVVSGGTLDEIEKRMDKFLEKKFDLSVEETTFLMAAYVYGGKNRKIFQKSYPGVECVEIEKVNQMVGSECLPSHCSIFAKQYRQIIIGIQDEQLKEEFFKIFAMRFESEEEYKMFNGHKSDVNVVQDAPKMPDGEKAQMMQENKEGMFSHLCAVESNYLLITGAGVSAQLVKTTETPRWSDPSFVTVSNWGGLIGLVRKRIEEFMGNPINGYFGKWYPTVDDKKLPLMTRARTLYGMISVYNLYHGADIDYTRFISRLFHCVAPATPTPALATALGSRNVPIATTNYDMLQEACLNRFEYNLAEQFQYEGKRAEIVEDEMDKVVPANYK